MSTGQIPAKFEDAFEELFPRAYRVAYRILGQVEAAEDAAAEALARTFLHWSKVRDLPYREAWVARVAGNLALDALRRQPTRKVGLEEVGSSSPQEVVDLRLALTAALLALPRRQRQAVVLRYLADLPQDEVASVLHISTGSVKLHVHRGLVRLRSLLGPNFSEVLPVVEH